MEEISKLLQLQQSDFSDSDSKLTSTTSALALKEVPLQLSPLSLFFSFPLQFSLALPLTLLSSSPLQLSLPFFSSHKCLGGAQGVPKGCLGTLRNPSEELQSIMRTDPPTHRQRDNICTSQAPFGAKKRKIFVNIGTIEVIIRVTSERI